MEKEFYQDKKRNVIFFTEYSSSIGSGHITRCCALAEEFSKRNFNIEFVIRGGNLAPKINFQHTLYEWADSLIIEKYDLNSTFFVFDTYKIKRAELQKLAEKIEYPISISDSQQNYIEKGLVIFTSAYGKEIVEQLNKTTYDSIAGVKYVVFKNEFTNQAYHKKVISQDVNKIVISLGGFVNPNLLLSVIDLANNVFSQPEIVVLGNVPQINRRDLQGVDFKKFVDTRQYISILQDADVAILNGGQSLNEALLLKVPSIAIPIVENQKRNIQYWSQKSACLTVDNNNQSDFENDFTQVLRKVSNIDTRRNLISQNTELDGLGAERIIDFLIYK